MIPLHVLPADPHDAGLLDRVVKHLERGGLIAYPTETVYGLGAAVREAEVGALRVMKGREEGKPFLVLLPPDAGAAGDQAREAAGDEARDGSWGLEWSPAARALARRFWPGPLTLVLSDPGERFPEGVRSPAGGVAVRRSPHPFVDALLRRWGRPLLSTSANRPGEAPAGTAAEVEAAVEGRPGLHLLWILDGGPLVAKVPSTVVDATGPRPRILRGGAIAVDELRAVLPDLDDGAQ